MCIYIYIYIYRSGTFSGYFGVQAGSPPLSSFGRLCRLSRLETEAARRRAA